MSNDAMKAGRYARWAQVRSTYRMIDCALAEGAIVTVSTYTKVTRYDARHRDLFSTDRRHVYVRHGKRNLAIAPDLCAIRVWPAGTTFSGTRK